MNGVGNFGSGSGRPQGAGAAGPDPVAQVGSDAISRTMYQATAIQQHSGSAGFRMHMNTLDNTSEQLAAVDAFFTAQENLRDRLEYREAAADAANDEYREALAA